MMTHRGNEPPSAKERNPNYGLQMDLHTKRVSMKNSSILKSEVEPLICDYVPKNQIIVHNDLQLLFPHDVLPMDGLTRYQEPAFREIRSGQKVNDSIYNSFKVYVPAASLMMLNSFSAFNGLKIEFSESKECLNMSYMIEQVSNYNYCEKFTMIVQMHEHYHLVCTKIRNIICTIPGLKNLKLPQKRTACSGLIECPEPLTNDFTNIIKAYNLKVELFGGYADVDHISNGYFWCFGIAKVKSYPQFSLFFSDMLLCCRSNLSDEMLVHQLSMHHNENIFNFSRAICVNDYCNFPAALPTPQRIRVVPSIFASIRDFYLQETSGDRCLPASKISMKSLELLLKYLKGARTYLHPIFQNTMGPPKLELNKSIVLNQTEASGEDGPSEKADSASKEERKQDNFDLQGVRDCIRVIRESREGGSGDHGAGSLEN